MHACALGCLRSVAGRLFSSEYLCALLDFIVVLKLARNPHTEVLACVLAAPGNAELVLQAAPPPAVPKLKVDACTSSHISVSWSSVRSRSVFGCCCCSRLVTIRDGSDIDKVRFELEMAVVPAGKPSSAGLKASADWKTVFSGQATTWTSPRAFVPQPLAKYRFRVRAVQQGAEKASGYLCFCSNRLLTSGRQWSKEAVVEAPPLLIFDGEGLDQIGAVSKPRRLCVIV